MATFEVSLPEHEYRPLLWEKDADFERNIREKVLAVSAIKLEQENFVLKAIGEYAAEMNLLGFFHELAERDPRTYAHVMRVSCVAIDMAMKLGIKGEYLKEIGLGTMLHDIGKEKISLDLLHKPGTFTSEEWQVVQNHTLEGLEMVRTDKRFARLAGDKLVQAIIAGHHGAKKNDPYPIDLSNKAAVGPDPYDLNVTQWSPEVWRAVELAAASDTFDGISARDRSYHPAKESSIEVFSEMKKEIAVPAEFMAMAVSHLREEAPQAFRAAA